MKLNEKIRFLRESKKMSQEQMAQRLSMSLTGYAKIERGENSINFQRLEKIASILGIDVLEILLLGERNVIYFNSSYSINPYGSNLNTHIHSSEDLAFAIYQLKSLLIYKDEVIAAKNSLIQCQQQEIELLKKLLLK